MGLPRGQRAAYVTVLVPAAALIISTVLENYQWTLLCLVGVTLVLFGNYVITSQKC